MERRQQGNRNSLCERLRAECGDGGGVCSSQASWLQHLDACQACREWLDDQAAAEQVLRSLAASAPPVGDLRPEFYSRLSSRARAQRTSRLAWTGAAAACVLALVSGWISSARRPITQPQPDRAALLPVAPARSGGAQVQDQPETVRAGRRGLPPGHVALSGSHRAAAMPTMASEVSVGRRPNWPQLPIHHVRRIAAAHAGSQLRAVHLIDVAATSAALRPAGPARAGLEAWAQAANQPASGGSASVAGPPEPPELARALRALPDGVMRDGRQAERLEISVASAAKSAPQAPASPEPSAALNVVDEHRGFHESIYVSGAATGQPATVVVESQDSTTSPEVDQP